MSHEASIRGRPQSPEHQFQLRPCRLLADRTQAPQAWQAGERVIAPSSARAPAGNSTATPFARASSGSCAISRPCSTTQRVGGRPGSEALDARRMLDAHRRRGRCSSQRSRDRGVARSDRSRPGSPPPIASEYSRRSSERPTPEPTERSLDQRSAARRQHGDAGWSARAQGFAGSASGTSRRSCAIPTCWRPA